MIADNDGRTKRGARKSRRGPSLWLTAILSIVAVSTATAQAQTFDISSGEAAEALNEFAQQADVSVVYRADKVAGFETNAVDGTYEPKEALELMLADTGLSLIQGRSDAFAVRAVTDEEGSSGSGNAQPASSQVLMAQNQTSAVQIQPNPRDKNNNLNADEKQLEEIVVFGSRIRGMKEVAVPTIVIGREQINQAGYTGVDDIFERLPQNFADINPAGRFADGSNLARLNENRAAAVDLRGLGTQSTLVLLNGTRRAGGNLGRSVDISAIPLSIIERVEVVTGGRSSIYGADAVAGVVNIVTRREFSGAETQALYGWAKNGAEQIQISQLAGIDRTRGGFAVAYDYKKGEPLDLLDTGLEVSPLPSGVVLLRNDLITDNERHSVFLSGRFILNSRSELYADALYIHKKFDADERTLRPGATNASSSFFSQTSNEYSIDVGSRIDIGKSWMLDVSAGTSVTETDHLSDGNFDFGPFAITQIFNAERKITLPTVTAVVDGELFPIGGITPRAAFGVEAREETFKNAGVSLVFNGTPLPVTNDPRDRTVRSVFAELYFPLLSADEPTQGGHLDFTVAGRYDDYSDFGGTFNPQAGIIWEPKRGVVLRGAYSTAFRAPSLIDLGLENTAILADVVDPVLGGGTSPVLYWDGVNLTLGPEEADTWSVGFDLDFTPSTRMSVSYFDVDYDGRVDTPVSGSAARALILGREGDFGQLLDRNPTDSEIQNIMALASRGISNDTGTPWDPDTEDILDVFPNLIVFDNRTNNIGVEAVNGIDLSFVSEFNTDTGRFDFGLNGTYVISHDRSITTTSPAFSLLNEVGKPVDLRLRGKAGWVRGAIGTHLYVNYVDNYDNPFSSPTSEIDSWTTVDLSFRLDGSRLAQNSWMRKIKATLSANNLFDEDPPRFLQSSKGLGYDATNANPTGRYLTLKISVTWQ